MRPPWLPSTWAHPALVHGPRSAVHSFTVRGGMAVSKETPSPDGSPKAAADDGAPAVDPAAALPSLVKMAPGILKLRSEDVHAHCLPLDTMVLSALLYVFISGLWVFPSKSALDSIILMRHSIFQLVPYQPRAIRSAPEFMNTRYDPSETYTWAFAGFDLLTSSFWPQGHRTEEAINQLCASSLANYTASSILLLLFVLAGLATCSF